MIQNATNILDQSLGGFETQPTGSQTGTPTGETGSVSFGDLLGLLAAGCDSQMSVTAEQNVSDLASGAEEPTIAAQPFLALVADSAAVNFAQQTEQDVTLGSSPQALTDATALLMKEAAFRAFDVVSINQNIKALLDQSPSALESAVYKILDARIVGDTLELTVAGDSATASPVRISVPAELLRQAQQAETRQSVDTGNTDARTTDTLSALPAWDETLSVDLQLDELMSRVNLKALEIRLDPAAQESAATPSKVAVTLVAEMGGQQLILKNKLDAQKVVVNRTDNSSGTAQPHMGQSSPTGSKALTGVTPTQTESHSSPRPVAVPSKTITVNQSFDLMDRLAGGSGKTASPNMMVTGDVTSPQFDNQSKTPDASLPQVRLYLTEPIQPQVRAQGQTLMLKIEPESLGPARLNLVMRQDVLTARVTVETPLAKAAVESSLDQLTQQLSRAGVQVQRIDVALDGGGMRNQFSDRRPEWYHDNGRMAARQTRESESEQVTSSTVLSPPVYEYLRIDGVNLLA